MGCFLYVVVNCLGWWDLFFSWWWCSCDIIDIVFIAIIIVHPHPILHLPHQHSLHLLKPYPTLLLLPIYQSSLPFFIIPHPCNSFQTLKYFQYRICNTLILLVIVINLCYFIMILLCSYLLRFFTKRLWLIGWVLSVRL